MSHLVKYKSKIDVAVLILFFARPEPLSKVFEQVKIARPSKLYLYQDGPRANRPDDIENIDQCREIVKDIDWECEVHYKYQTENFGCDPSEFISQKWMFETEVEGIVLEDDDVPSQSFFTFCKEMLTKYRDDDRIGVVCGMNNLGIYNDTPDSYIFARTGSIWGWATWKRNVDLWEEHYDYLKDKHALKLLNNLVGSTDFKHFHALSRVHKESGKAHYETILGASVLFNAKLNIIPHKNLISNIGIGANGTHSVDTLQLLPKAIQKVLFMETHELDFPLRHPKYMIEDVNYKKKLDRLLGNGYPMVKFSRMIESIVRRVLLGDFKNLNKSLKRRFLKS